MQPQPERTPSSEQPHSKILEYIERVKAGQTIESFGEIPESWKSDIQNGLKAAELKKDIERTMEQPLSLEALGSKLHELSSRYHFLTHQTFADVAKKINEEGFLFQAGGLNTTTTYEGPDSIMLALERMEEGESHRGSDGMLIMAVPKDEFASYGARFSPDAFADMLVETQLDAIAASGDLRVPTRYNLGVYDKAAGFVLNPAYR